MVNTPTIGCLCDAPSEFVVRIWPHGTYGTPASMVFCCAEHLANVIAATPNEAMVTATWLRREFLPGGDWVAYVQGVMDETEHVADESRAETMPSGASGGDRPMQQGDLGDGAYARECHPAGRAR